MKRPTMRDYLRVYRAVRNAGLSWWRALRCCNDVRCGHWRARNVGELAAQLALVSAAVGGGDSR